MNRKTYLSLQELTGQEAGAVLYGNGDIWIGNWLSIKGLPNIFAFSTISLGEGLIGTRCRVPIVTELQHFWATVSMLVR